MYNCYNENDLYDILIENEKNSYDLLYIFCNEKFYFSSKITDKYKMKLADRKIIYKKELSDNGFCGNVFEYNTDTLNSELEDLAYNSGKYSRFKTDKNFCKNDFYRLYKTWIEKSIRKEIANKVYITKNNEKINGMITLKHNNNYSEIGLIAVNTNERLKGLGKELVNKCFENSLENKIAEIKVTTQLGNEIACKFYKKCGFQKDNITNIYHLWL